MSRFIGKIDENKKLKQSNRLVEAKYKLTLSESKIVYTILSQIHKNGENLEAVRVSAAALIDFCGFDKKHGYSELKSACQTLRERSVTLRYPDGAYEVIGWVDSIRYNAGVVDFKVGDALKEVLMNLKEAYLVSSAKMICSFKHDYSARLYMLLKKSLKFGEKEYNLDYIREQFILPLSYSKTAHFERKFVVPCLHDINEKSDIAVSYELLKEGRAYAKIKFKIRAKNKAVEKIKKENPKKMETYIGEDGRFMVAPARA